VSTGTSPQKRRPKPHVGDSVEREEEEPQPKPSFVRQLIAWLGRFHPALVHFPIGLLLAAAASEVLLVGTRLSVFESASRVCIWFAGVSAPPVATLGWFLAGAQLTDSNWVLTAHRWLGTSTALGALALLFLSEVYRGFGRPTALAAHRASQKGTAAYLPSAAGSTIYITSRVAGRAHSR
jgi:uncharacterized membrane protein